MSVIIKKSENNYYKTTSGIGPRFGAVKEEAKVFDTRADAALAMNHFAFADCEIEEVIVGN